MDLKVVKHHYIEDYQKEDLQISMQKTYTEVTLTMLNKSKATDVTAETLLAEGIIEKLMMV